MRKEATEMDRERQRPFSISFTERAMENELNALITYLRRAPKIVQKQFAPFLNDLRKDQPNHIRLQTYLEQLMPNTQRYQVIEGSADLVYNYLKSFQLRNLSNFYSKIADRIDAELNKPNRKKQEIFTERENFGAIELLYPDYDSYYKMSKQEKSHLAQHHPKPKQRDFFVEPRFLVRIEEFEHFRNNDAHKGDVVYLQYEGNTIAGSKVFLVANHRCLELWLSESNNYPMPVLTIPTEEELERKKEEELKKDKEKVQENNLAPMKLEFTHKFLGHNEKITSLSLSQDQYYAISGSADRTIKLWCLRMKICLATYRGHTKTVWDVAFSTSGYYFLSGSNDGLMMLWKTDEPHAQRVYNNKSEVYKVSFARDPSHVICAGEDATIRIWKTLEAELVKEIRLNQPILTFNVGFSGAYLATIEIDGRISLLDLLRGVTINSFYFQALDRRKSDDKEGRNKILKIHDVCLSQDERELSCVSSNYVLVYSMDKLEKKITKNIFSLYKQNSEDDKILVIEPKEVLYMGGDTNLTHCSYQSRNVLVVAGQFKY